MSQGLKQQQPKAQASERDLRININSRASRRQSSEGEERENIRKHSLNINKNLKLEQWINALWKVQCHPIKIKQEGKPY